MKKLFVAAFIFMVFGAGHLRGNTAIIKTPITTEAEMYDLKPSDFQFVEDGVYVHPSYAIDLFP